MLTKQESKFRTKIIQENHLKKTEQIAIDNFIKKSDYMTYRYLYYNHKVNFEYYFFNLERGFRLISKAATELAKVIDCSLGNMIKSYKRLMGQNEL